MKAKEFHKATQTPEYRIWAAVIQRCTNPNVINFKHYGGRGVKICDEWRNSFEMFFQDVGPRPSSKHSLDRIDNSKGYEPNNCRWVLKQTQARNHRANVNITLNGVTKTIVEWAEETGIKPTTLYMRHRRGYKPENILHKGLFNSKKQKS